MLKRAPNAVTVGAQPRMVSPTVLSAPFFANSLDLLFNAFIKLELFKVSALAAKLLVIFSIDSALMCFPRVLANLGKYFAPSSIPANDAANKPNFVKTGLSASVCLNSEDFSAAIRLIAKTAPIAPNKAAVNKPAFVPFKSFAENPVIFLLINLDSGLDNTPEEIPVITGKAYKRAFISLRCRASSGVFIVF